MTPLDRIAQALELGRQHRALVTAAAAFFGKTVDEWTVETAHLYRGDPYRGSMNGWTCLASSVSGEIACVVENAP